MGRKTLVKKKNKKKKEKSRTKKRQLKKYVGGDIKQILNAINPQLTQQITECFNGNVCERSRITKTIMSLNIPPQGKRELLQYIDQQLSLTSTDRYINDKLKKINNNALNKKIEEYFNGTLTNIDYIQQIITKTTLPQEDKIKLLDEINKKMTNSYSEKAIQKFEGKTDAWLEIKNLLSTEFVMLKNTGDWNQYEGQNSTNQRIAKETIDLAFKLLKKFENDSDYEIKKKEFYRLLYDFGTIKCWEFKYIRSLAIKYCLEGKNEEVYNSIINKKNIRIYEEFLNWFKDETYYFLKIDIQYIVQSILDLYKKLLDYFKNENAYIVNVTTGGFIILMNRLFVNYIDNKLSRFSNEPTWREELNSKVNTFFVSIYSTLVVIREKKCDFLLRTYYNLVNHYNTVVLNAICKIVTLKRNSERGKIVNPNTCNEGLARNDETYKKIDNFIKSVADNIIDPAKNIVPL
jgi:hypothetical protein